MQELNQEDFAAKMKQDDQAVLLDVRTDAEVAEGYIPNAQQLNILNSGYFMEEAKKLDPNKNYYIYCRSGGRSAQACMLLDSLGVQNTYNLIGGFSEWKGDRIS